MDPGSTVLFWRIWAAPVFFLLVLIFYLQASGWGRCMGMRTALVGDVLREWAEEAAGRVISITSWRKPRIGCLPSAAQFQCTVEAPRSVSQVAEAGIFSSVAGL